MGTITQNLQSKIIAAMKAKSPELATLRMLSAAIKNAQIEKGELSDADELALIRKLSKQRYESAATYQDAGRDELAEKERAEAQILDGFLPPPLSDDELKAIIQDVAQKNPDQEGMKLMRFILPEVDGRADAKRVGEILRSL